MLHLPHSQVAEAWDEGDGTCVLEKIEKDGGDKRRAVQICGRQRDN